MTNLFWFYVVAALVVGLACYIGYLIGQEVSDRNWEEEWERRKTPLAPESWTPVERLSLPEPLHLRMTDRVAHPKVYASLSAHLVAAEVIEPVRTQVEVYRARHSTEDPTVAIDPAILPRRHDDTFWNIVKPIGEPVRLR